MKFPTRPGKDEPRTSEKTPDVTRGVLDRLGVSDEPVTARPTGREAVGQVYRFRFVIVLGGIVLASILWKSLTPSGESVQIVEQFPQTIHEGRAQRAQLLMGFMAPFDKVDRAIAEVGQETDSMVLIGGSGVDFEDTPGVLGGQPSAPDEVDILEAAAPFPSS